MHDVDVEEKGLCHVLCRQHTDLRVLDGRLGMRPGDVYVGFVMLVSRSTARSCMSPVSRLYFDSPCLVVNPTSSISAAGFGTWTGMPNPSLCGVSRSANKISQYSMTARMPFLTRGFL